MILSNSKLVLFALFLLILISILPSNSYPSHDLEARDNADERSGYFEGDIIITLMSSRSGLTAKKSRWPNSTLVYIFHSQFAENEKQIILSAMNEISSQTCIKFREKISDDVSYVFLKRGQPSSGCSSSIGRTGKRQELNLEVPNCLNHGVIMHELFHSLGFVHEHSRTDRDEFVDINYANIKSGAESNFQKYRSGVIDSFGIGYDYESIMHYSAYAFAKDQNQKTIFTKKGELIGQRERLSDKDVQKLNQMYCINVK